MLRPSIQYEAERLRSEVGAVYVLRAASITVGVSSTWAWGSCKLRKSGAKDGAPCKYRPARVDGMRPTEGFIIDIGGKKGLLLEYIRKV